MLAFQFFTLPQQGKVGRRPFTNGIVIDLTQERGGGEDRLCDCMINDVPVDTEGKSNALISDGGVGGA